MSFVSLAFLVFYPVVLVLYYALGTRRRAQNGLLLAASYFFYGWWDWRFLALLLFTTLLDYTAARVISERPPLRKTALALSIGTNLTVLFVFKYYDFFAGQLNALLVDLGYERGLALLRVALPIGVSFYTFQSMAYTIDVYRGVVRAERDLLTFLAFVTFFPQLVAGPIERARELLPQFHRERVLTREAVQRGVWLTAWGSFLKMVVGDSAALIADAAFRADQQYGWSVILGTVAFGIQIFGDFAGYSSIAKGVAALLGFELVWNFRQPYWSKSVREFWQRWHVSLSTWLRDYLYISLGGNRRGAVRTHLNLIVTMALGGLWHGAGWNFLFWGLLHGGALSIHRLWDTLRPARWQLPAPLAWALTMLVVFTGWFFFRARDWDTMAGMSSALRNLTWGPGHAQALCTLAVLMLPVVVVEWLQLGRRGPWAIAEAHWALRAVVNAAAVLLILAVVDRARSEFIYFQF